MGRSFLYMETKSTQHWAYLDYGVIGDPGIIISRVELDDGQVVGETEVVWVNDDRCELSADRMEVWDAALLAMDAWDEVLAEHGFRRVGNWEQARGQYTATVAVI